MQASQQEAQQSGNATFLSWEYMPAFVWPPMHRKLLPHVISTWPALGGRAAVFAD